jgi:hypothetical protein
MAFSQHVEVAEWTGVARMLDCGRRVLCGS